MQQGNGLPIWQSRTEPPKILQMVAEQKGRRATLPDTETTSPDDTVFPLKIQKILAGAKKAFEKAETIADSTHAARQWLAYLAEQNRTTEDPADGG